MSTRYQPALPSTSSTVISACRKGRFPRIAGETESMSATYCPIQVFSSRSRSALLPGADLLALKHLQVVREPADDEHVRELRAEAVVELGLAALRGLPEVLGLLAAVGREEAALSESFR